MNNALTDFVKDGKVLQHQQVTVVMVRGQDDLAALGAYGYTPGSIAYTAGFKQMWQLGADGTWAEMTKEG